MVSWRKRKDAIQKSQDDQAEKLLQEAVNYVAQKSIVTMPRPAVDYEIDFERLMQFRTSIQKVLEELAKENWESTTRLKRIF